MKRKQVRIKRKDLDTLTFKQYLLGKKPGEYYHEYMFRNMCRKCHRYVGKIANR